MSKKNRRGFADLEKSSIPVEGQPENVVELVNKYGTYNIQPTNDSDNEFPEIAQGLPKAKEHKEVEPEFRGE